MPSLLQLPRLVVLAALGLNVVPVVQSSVMEDGFGYQASTNVTSILNLALDIQQMRELTDFDQKKNIYENGQQNNGVSLRQLSTDAETNFGPSPLYNIYKAGFALLGQEQEGDLEGIFDGNPVSVYADTIVNDLFLLDVTHIEAEAALAMNVAMAFWGSLWDLQVACGAKDNDFMNQSLDAAAAYWVGEGQVKGDGQTGHLFYNLAQFVGTKFNQDVGDSEVDVNKAVIGSLLALKALITNRECDYDNGYVTFRNEVKKMVGHLNRVLVQMLIHRVETIKPNEDTDFVELYSLALLPQIAACNPDAYYTLVRLTIEDNVSADTQSTVISTLQSVYSCLHITCEEVGAYLGNRVPACSDTPTTLPAIAGYSPKTDVRGFSYMDRDIRQIRLLNRYGAVKAAKDMYLYGWNGDLALTDIATNSFEMVSGDAFDAIATYYEEEDGTAFDSIIRQIFDIVPPYNQPSLEVRATMIDGFLKGALMYLATTASIESALFSCGQNDVDSSTRLVDQAVAFFVGSTEGRLEGGADSGPGDSLWGLGDTYCEFFGSCEPNDAEINERIMDNFRGLSEAVTNQACDQISDIYSQNIRPILPVALMQGILYNYIQWASGTETSLGYVYSFSRMMMPLFATGQTGAQQAIEDLNVATDYTISPQQPSQTDVSSLFGYFDDILQVFPTPCEDIGTVEVANGLARDVCPGNSPMTPPPARAPTVATAVPTLGSAVDIVAPTRAPAGIPRDVPEDHPDGIAWGRYQFVNQAVANNDARFSLDIKAMYTSGSLVEAQTAYESGTNVASPLYGTNDVQTVADLSREAMRLMGEDILHNFYLYALFDDDAFDQDLQGNQDSWPYGDKVVSLALDTTHGDSTKLAAEAAIVMNVFMMIAHQMSEAVSHCLAGSGDSASYVDSAVALWIGEEQGEGVFDTGYSLYGVAQEVFKYYGNDAAEAPANSALMTLFREAQDVAKSCSADGARFGRILYAHMNLIIKELSKPLMQMLLYYMSVQDTNFAELFSLAFIPQVITCNIDEFDLLRDELFQGGVFEDDDEQKLAVMRNLAGGLSCLGYTCEDLGDASQADESLRVLVVDLCEDLANDYDQGYLASYQITEDEQRIAEVHEFARLDLDLLQINILMRANAVKNAEEIFDFGRNSRGPNFMQSFAYNTLKELSNDELLSSAGEIYAAYENFPQVYGGSIAAEVFSQPRYDSATRAQKAEVVVRSIQTTVAYLNVVARVRESVNVCRQNSIDVSTLYVDQAAAVFVGSIEGSKSGGSSTGSGTMLMGLGKEVCGSFDTCAAHGDAAANEFILFAFSDMKEWLESSDCDSAENIMNESILPMLPVSMIQATIKFAFDVDSALSTEEEVGTVDAIAKSIIPLVNAVNTTSAATLAANLEYDPARSPIPEGPNVVVDAIAYALRGMQVDCNAVGTISGVSTCKAAEVIPPPPTTPTNLGDDKYTSTTYVQDRADIAKDVEEIQSALSLTVAKDIYSDGAYSPIYDDAGTRIANRSLKRFSTEAETTMKSNPLYQATVFSLRDGAHSYLGTPATQYADSIVQEAFDKSVELAAEAALALNLWMEATNELFQMLYNCRYKRLRDDDGIHSIDEAAAYWLGDAMADEEAGNGHLLYALTELMAKEFGTVGRNGQAIANTNLLQLFQAAKLELSYPDACSDDITTLRRVRHLTNQAVAQMMVPLIQGLINSIIRNDRDRVRVYAHAVVPQVAVCGRSPFNFLMDKLIINSYTATEIDNIVLMLQSTYECLGLSCFDIGIHQDSDLDIDCEDDDEIKALAGFRTRTNAGQYAKLDLDIEELDILMAMEAYEAAQELYRFGRHAQSGLDDGRASLSLQHVATDTGRTSVPEFVVYEQFFGNDANYADTMITKMFNPLDSPEMSSAHRRYAAVATAQYVIMVMGAVHAMQSAISECERDSEDITASEYWDRAAAYIIGHMEGQGKGGTGDGRLVWSLAKNVCDEWGTCSATVEGNAATNERILSLLYTGRGALTSGSCKGVTTAVKELREALRVPLVQGAISAVVKTEESTGAQKEAEHAKAHAISNSILPLIAATNRQSANTIQSNLDFNDAPLSSGLTKVVDSFTGTLKGLGVDCGDVGRSSVVDPCSGQVSEGKGKALLIIVVIVLTLATLGLGFLVYRKRRKNKTKDEPVFVPNDKGELSHSEVIGNGSPSRAAAQEMSMNHNDADAAHEDDFEHAELPETV